IYASSHRTGVFGGSPLAGSRPALQKDRVSEERNQLACSERTPQIASYLSAGSRCVHSWSARRGATMQPTSHLFQHPVLTRRTAIRAGAVSLLGLGSGELAALRAAEAPPRACIYIFLSGGLSQHDSFDLKPDAPAEIRGEF